MRPGRPHRRLITIALAAGLVASLATTASAGSTAEPPTGASKSDNITHLANVPIQAPLAGSINSDIAFEGKKAYVGHYNGFQIYDISKPAQPTLISQVLCPGSQNDISVYDGLLFLSTDSSRNNNSCASTSQSPTIKESWEGIKIFDVRDAANPRYIAAVETKCGSHTHTLVPDKKRGAVYVYNSSFFPDATYPDCQPPNDLIDIIKVPLRNPAAAAVVASPVLFPDGGFPGSPTGYDTNGCHDITAYPAKKLAAGACMGDGILMDISNPVKPKVIDRVQDAENFSFWHSATFSQDGKKVVFTDELGGGGGAECNAVVGPNKGADAIFDVRRGKLEFRSYFKIPRHQAEGENCVAHNGSLIPAKGRDIMVQAWHPKEIGYFDRPQIEGGGFAGYWSVYYYNGHIYGTETLRGFDVFKVSDRRTDSAARIKLDELNVQTQPTYK
jgi:LVIVD repeat-containing protein